MIYNLHKLIVDYGVEFEKDINIEESKLCVETNEIGTFVEELYDLVDDLDNTTIPCGLINFSIVIKISDLWELLPLEKEDLYDFVKLFD